MKFISFEKKLIHFILHSFNFFICLGPLRGPGKWAERLLSLAFLLIAGLRPADKLICLKRGLRPLFASKLSLSSQMACKKGLRPFSSHFG